MMSDLPVNALAASKSMSRLRIAAHSEALQLEVVWCRIMYRRYEKKYTRMHHHAFYEFHLALKGSCIFQTSDNRLITLQQDEFLMIPPSVPHEYLHTSEDFEDFVAGIQLSPKDENPDGHFLRQAMELAVPLTPHPATKRMNRYVRDFEESAYYNHPGLSAISSALMQLLLFETARCLYPQYAYSKNNRRSFESDVQVEFVRKYIESNLHTKITAELIARQMNLSVKQLNRILKDSLNTTVSQMMRQAKLTHIRQLLENTNLTLDQIAAQVGFSNEYNMSRFFKQAEGMPPGIYRKSLEK